MDPNSTTDPMPDVPPSEDQTHLPGQVIGPTGSVSSEIPPPPTVEVPEVIQTMPNESAHPTAVAGSSQPTDGVILPPQTTVGVVNGQAQSFQAPSFEQPKQSFFKNLAGKKLILLIGLPLLLASSSAAAYFGYYTPNKPENIWAKALTNTGKGYDKLSSYIDDQLNGKTKGAKLSGSYKLTGAIAADGSFEGTSDGDNAVFTGTFSAAGVKVNLDARAIKSSGNSPDVYFKVDGLQGIGTLLGGAGSQYEQALNGVNGNWYFVDHTLFDQFTGSASTGLQVTQDDVRSVLKAVGDASKQNVFTSDTSKMAFKVKQNIGKEKQDGRNVYHYKVAVDKTNLQTYVTALCSNLKNSNLKKFFNNNPTTVDDTIGCNTAKSSISKFDENRTADVWVDTRTKLIHKIRFTDTNNKDNYFDIGQDYQGGDSLPFSLTSHSKDGDVISDGGLILTLNMKTNVISMDGSIQEKSNGTTDFGGSFKLTVTPSNSAVKVEKPAGAKNIIELLNDLGFSDIFGGGGPSSRADDTERKTDINALHGQVEAYQAVNGMYPSLAEMNDPSWRSKNLKGLDDAALQDPAGSAKTLVAAPVAHSYSYQATPAGCDNASKGDCTGYTLTATLDGGGTYVKQALNDTNFDQPTILQ
jgi:hypothetical protein